MLDQDGCEWPTLDDTRTRGHHQERKFRVRLQTWALLHTDARLMETMLPLSRRSTVPALLVFALLISASAGSTDEGDEDARLSHVRLEFEGDDDSPRIMDDLFDSIDMHVEEPNVRTVLSSTRTSARDGPATRLFPSARSSYFPGSYLGPDSYKLADDGLVQIY